MSEVFQISEHQILPEALSPYTFSEEWKAGLCLNPNASDFDRRYLFVWDVRLGEWCYQATYTIGAWWLSEKDEVALAVTTDKIESVDFLRMFTVCLESGLNADDFQKIYGINSNAKPIKINKLDSALSPLIITHYIGLLKELISKGLKRNYVNCEDNLRKLRGKLQIFQNQILNVNHGRLDKFYCRFQEYTVDTPENRLLKKALLFAEKALMRFGTNPSYMKLQQIIMQCKTAFNGVSDDISPTNVRQLKTNKLFKEYAEAIRLAKIILKRYDFSLTKTEIQQEYVMPFWIDMPLLFEHYVHGLLKKAYGSKIIYQYRGVTGVPDFLYDDITPMILDTKYIVMEQKDTRDLDTGIIRQLSGYARDMIIRKKLHCNDSTVIPCVFIYPTNEEDCISQFERHDILNHTKRLSGLLDFYKIGLRIPLIKKNP